MISIDTHDAPSLNLDADEAALMDEISIAPPDKKIPIKAKPVRTVPRFAPRAAPPEPVDEVGLGDFMNPDKRFAPAPPPAEEWIGDEDDEEPPMMQSGGGGGEQPSEGYKTIEDEKADLLNKISRLLKKGIQGNARLNSYSSVEEIRTEYKRMMYSIEVDRSIKFQRRMLIATVTGLEFLNKKFDPFDLQLDGWSENMMENVDDYDGVFEELYNKYKNKVEVAPEIKLIMMVGGSAMMFHLTNSMFKQAVNVTQVMQQNPDLARNMVEAVQRAQAASGPGLNIPPGPPPPAGLRREMQGPGMDFGSLMSMMGPPPPAVQVNDDTVSDIMSDAGGDGADGTREVSLSAPKKGRGRPKGKKEISI
jgi:Family of unknown function (DUF5767)